MAMNAGIPGFKAIAFIPRTALRNYNFARLPALQVAKARQFGVFGEGYQYIFREVDHSACPVLTGVEIVPLAIGDGSQNSSGRAVRVLPSHIAKFPNLPLLCRAIDWSPVMLDCDLKNANPRHCYQFPAEKWCPKASKC